MTKSYKVVQRRPSKGSSGDGHPHEGMAKCVSDAKEMFQPQRPHKASERLSVGGRPKGVA